jgi:EmrB/QacA subfamily drug resistance transporter
MAVERQVPPEGRVNDAAGGVRGWTLTLVCVATFMLMLDVTAVVVALPALRTSLRTDLPGAQWVVDAYTLALAAFLLTAGTLADRLGRKRAFVAGIVLFTLASLVVGVAPGILVVNIARAVQGTGAAVLFAVGPALLGQEFTGADRGKAFGLLGSVIGLALAVGPVVGGLVTTGLSWRWIFLLNVPIGAFALVAAVRRLRESRTPVAGGIDWAGTAVFGLAITALVLAFLRAEAAGWSSPLIVGLFAAGVAGLAAFVAQQRRLGPRAMFDLSLFGIPSFTGITVSTLFSNAAILAGIFLEIFYVQDALGHSPVITGLIFLPQTLTIFVVANITGAVMNKFPPGVLVGAAIAFIAAGLALAVLVGPHSSWVALLPFMVVTGIGMGIFNPPRAMITIGVTEPAKAGMANGMGETFQQVGTAIGIAAFGAVFHAQVVSSFTSSSLGKSLGSGASALGTQIATRGESAVSGAARDAAAAAYVHGLDTVMAVTAIVAAVGAIIAFLLIRSSDMHPSAMGEGQPDGA